MTKVAVVTGAGSGIGAASAVHILTYRQLDLPKLP